MSEPTLKDQIAKRIAARGGVWTPADFRDLGSRDAIDKILQRLTRDGALRRITRGLYHRPRRDPLTGRDTTADARDVIDAIARRDQTRMLVDGITAANDLGLTTAVPARIVVHTDSRLRTIRLGDQSIEFKHTAPSKLYWAGRPAMRVVQALHWLRDMIPGNEEQVASRLRRVLADPEHGAEIVGDLRKGMWVMPEWMRGFVETLLASRAAASPGSGGEAKGRPRRRRLPEFEETIGSIAALEEQLNSRVDE